MSFIQSIESSLKKLLSSHEYGMSVTSSGISFIRSGSNSSTMNYAIFHNADNLEIKKEIFKDIFSTNGLVLSFPEDQDAIKNISKNMSYLGKILVSISKGYSGQRVHPEIHVETLSDKNIKDYISFMQQQRRVEPNILQNIIKSCKDDLYVYLAYDDGNVVGAGTAIRNETDIFIFDTIIREDKRNTGVFSAIVTQSMSDVYQTGDYDYYALISSENSLNGAMKANYGAHSFMDLWINEEGVE